MVMIEGYRQFPLPQAHVIFRGAAEGNKHWQGAMETDFIPKKYFNCFIVPIQYIYARLFAFVELFLNM